MGPGTANQAALMTSLLKPQTLPPLSNLRKKFPSELFGLLPTRYHGNAEKGKRRGNRGSSHPGVPLVQGLDIDEGHLSLSAGHHGVVLAADNQVDVLAELPVTVPEHTSRAAGVLTPASPSSSS